MKCLRPGGPSRQFSIASMIGLGQRVETSEEESEEDNDADPPPYQKAPGMKFLKPGARTTSAHSSRASQGRILEPNASMISSPPVHRSFNVWFNGLWSPASFDEYVPLLGDTIDFVPMDGRGLELCACAGEVLVAETAVAAGAIVWLEYREADTDALRDWAQFFLLGSTNKGGGQIHLCRHADCKAAFASPTAHARRWKIRAPMPSAVPCSPTQDWGLATAPVHCSESWHVESAPSPVAWGIPSNLAGVVCQSTGEKVSCWCRPTALLSLLRNHGCGMMIFNDYVRLSVSCRWGLDPTVKHALRLMAYEVEQCFEWRLDCAAADDGAFREFVALIEWGEELCGRCGRNPVCEWLADTECHECFSEH